MNSSNIYSFTCVLAKPDLATFMMLAKLIAAFEGVTIQDTVVLSPAKALDLTVEVDDLLSLQSQLDTLISERNLPIDYCLQRLPNRRKMLLICDMDSTLIGQECIDELADFAGVKDKVSDITERAMRGELGFEAALTERVSLLKGLSLTSLENCYKTKIFLNAGARTLAKTMSAHGATTVIVSGGFTYFSKRVADAAGFEYHRANLLHDDCNALCGTVERPILGREAKLQALNHFSAPLGGPSHAIAIGDGANDLAMIQAAGLGIAYKAKPIVATAAHCAINHTDLTSALYFQGYKDSEISPMEA